LKTRAVGSAENWSRITGFCASETKGTDSSKETQIFFIGNGLLFIIDNVLYNVQLNSLGGSVI
jgi:hypothetical protein